MNRGMYLLLGGVVLVGVWYYWTHRNTQGGGTAGESQAIQQDLAYYQAWQNAQAAAQPSGQNANPSSYNPGGTIAFGTPVGAGTSVIQTQNAAMSLPVNA